MKIEMHAHTSEASPCANVSAARIPGIYQSAGYDGIVITDHYCEWAQNQSGAANDAAYAEYFLNGYRTARAAAEQLDFTVLLGAEVNPADSPNDYLLYGAEEDFFKDHHDIHRLALPELFALCHRNGILLFQAHPYRSYCTSSDPVFLDGAESYNGNPRHENRNELAKKWVQENHLLPSSGSDFHEMDDLARGGIETDRPVRDIHTLCNILKNKTYHILRP